jgi:hypothetical protein
MIGDPPVVSASTESVYAVVLRKLGIGLAEAMQLGAAPPYPDMTKK